MIKEGFDECVKLAIEIGRPYMSDYIDNQPTQQEWELALILFQSRLKFEPKLIGNGLKK